MGLVVEVVEDVEVFVVLEDPVGLVVVEDPGFAVVEVVDDDVVVVGIVLPSLSRLEPSHCTPSAGAYSA